MEKKQRNTFLYLSVCAVNIISFTCGIAFTWASPVMPKLNGDLGDDQNPLSSPVSPTEESWIVSLFHLGAAIGPFASAITADKLGRKKTLLFFALPVVASFLIASVAYNVACFYASRFLLGLGLGCVFSVLPMYVAEISEDTNRGGLGCIMAIFMTSGNLFSLSVGPYLSIKLFCLLCAVPPIVFIIIFACFIPESPYFLVAINKKVAAEESLMRLRSKSGGDIQKELYEITKNVQTSLADRKGFLDIFKSKGLRKGLCISLGLVIFQQIAGVNVIMSYMQTIFEETGSAVPSEIAPIVIGTVQIISCAVASAVVDKIGRKFLLITSAVGSSLAEIALATFFYLKSSNCNVDQITWLPLLSIVAFIIAFNIGFGALPFMILGELFPSNAKNAASTLTVSVCLFLAFLITLLFPFLNDVLGLANSFYVFSSTLIAAGCFVYFAMPETKGKSLHKIQEMLEGR